EAPAAVGVAACAVPLKRRHDAAGPRALTILARERVVGRHAEAVAMSDHRVEATLHVAGIARPDEQLGGLLPIALDPGAHRQHHAVVVAAVAIAVAARVLEQLGGGRQVVRDAAAIEEHHAQPRAGVGHAAATGLLMKARRRPVVALDQKPALVHRPEDGAARWVTALALGAALLRVGPTAAVRRGLFGRALGSA